MPTKIVEGRKAPDFTLTDAQGKAVSPLDYKGKNVVVYFYPKDDTPGCTKEACGFRDFWKELQKAGVVVLPFQLLSDRSSRSGRRHLKLLDKRAADARLCAH